MAAVMRRMDSLAEYAPDEYAIVAPELDPAAAAQLAGRLIDAARNAGAVARTGVATFPVDGTGADALVSQARASLRRARTGKAPAAPAPSTVGDAIVADPRSRHLYELVGKVAATTMTVLILGETGTGKELIAEALHRGSGRAGGPLVRLNCASLPDTLLESELFGHERGAFTGADRRKVGFLEAADGGTLFLDEIGEMPLALQAKLLRVLEARVIMRVGGTQEVPVDVRLIAATHRNLEEEVRAGRFREDLYFRISTFTLAVPPLRDRKDDILPLAEHFARTFAAELGQPPPILDEELRRALLAYRWPGNVRELRNAIERAVVMQSSGTIAVELLPERVRAAEPAAGLVPAGDGVDMREHIADVERAAIVAALEATNGNQTRAAERLGLSRRALIYKLEKYGLKAPPVKR
jgi:DNA-binding NtrC family response regulator